MPRTTASNSTASGQPLDVDRGTGGVSANDLHHYDHLRHRQNQERQFPVPDVQLIDLRLLVESSFSPAVDMSLIGELSSSPVADDDLLVSSITGSASVPNATAIGAQSEAVVDEWRRHVAADVAIGALLSLFVVFAVAGNVLVIVAILTDRTLRQTGNYFLVSLAVADTLVGVAVMTFAAANDVLGRWPFGPIVCDLWLSADVMCSTASILNLCAVSLDRYVHIRRSVCCRLASEYLFLHVSVYLSLLTS
jgi:hypothetical protein